MDKFKIPDKKFYLKHLKKYSQYSNSNKWINWYVSVSKYKGVRTAKMLAEYKSSDASLLDLGCSIGLTLSMIAQKFPNSIGCDIDKTILEATRQILKKVGVKIPLVAYDGKRLPFPDNYFDIITSIEVIEHVKNPQLMLTEMNRVLKADGILHITTANKWWPYEPHFKLLLLSYLPEKLADWYVKLSRKGNHYHGIKLPSYGQFRKMVAKYFLIKDITFEMIQNYKKYNFDKERGLKVVLVGEFLKVLSKIEDIFLMNFLVNLLKWILIRVSLGWLFIGYPIKRGKL